MMQKGFIVAMFFLLSFSSYSEEAQTTDVRDLQFGSDFAYQSKFMKINGHQIHYIDKGEGQVFLFLHGNPTSMYLWRNVMPFVEPLGRIVAMDNIGFGRSEQPDLDYTYQTHYDYMSKFIQQQELKKIILVIHDWGSVLGLQYAMQNSRNVKEHL